MSPDRSSEYVAVLVATLTTASLVGLGLVLPPTWFLVGLSVGGLAAAYFVCALVAARRHAVTSVAFRAIRIALALIAIIAVVVLVTVAFRNELTLLSFVLLSALSLVFFYFGTFVPIVLWHRLFRATDYRATAPYPSVSVIIPAYNEAGTVSRSIESVIEADYPDEKKEIIVVDDGSTDETRRQALQYSDAVRVVSKENGGKYSALNYGMLFADGEIIVTVDADSVVERTALLGLVGALQTDPSAGAVAGNVKVGNRDRRITRIQTLEYVIGINVFRRVLDFCGAVMIVPGAIGAYRRSVLEDVNLYDPDTLTEDFDVTVQILKRGDAVRAIDAKSYTQAPATWRDLYQQRLRWYRGNVMTLFKHRDALANARFGVLHTVTFPFFLLSTLFVPLAGIAILVSIALGVLSGRGFELLSILLLFVLMLTLLSLLAIYLDDEDARLALYAPLCIVGYRQFCDLVAIRSVIDVVTKRDVTWTRPRRLAELERPDKEP